MLPEEIEGGRRIEGNSIWICKYKVNGVGATKGVLYQSFILSKKNCYASIDFANR